ncbi:MAG TPA: hypothetical protein VIU16_00740, partial [Gaiellaceae bacterium]
MSHSADSRHWPSSKAAGGAAITATSAFFTWPSARPCSSGTDGTTAATVRVATEGSGTGAAATIVGPTCVT